MLKKIKQKFSKFFYPNRIVNEEYYEIKDKNGNIVFNCGKIYYNSGGTHAFANKRIFNDKNVEMDRVHMFIDPKADVKLMYGSELKKRKDN